MVSAQTQTSNDKLRKSHGTVVVSKTILGSTVGNEEKIEIRPFVTDTANITVSYGTTMNVGDHNFLRMEIRVSVPCYKEEIEDVYYQTREYVENLLSSEISKAKKEMI
jgi:hypothetical protein